MIFGNVNSVETENHESLSPLQNCGPQTVPKFNSKGIPSQKAPPPPGGLGFAH